MHSLNFSSLPPELRLSIWEAANVSPSMHVFDLCMPEPPGARTTTSDAAERADIAFRRTSKIDDAASRETRYNNFKNTVFFDASSEKHDPSMYRWKMSLAASCVDARKVASPGRPAAGSATNSVYLPGPDRHIQYDNSADVLHLRLDPTISCPKKTRPSQTETAQISPGPSSTNLADGYTETGLLDYQWSPELAETIRTARYIALDAGQTNALVRVLDNPIFHEEIHMLASTMACALEALYLVDYCSSGACIGCGAAAEEAKKDWTKKKGPLYDGLNKHVSSAVATTISKDTPPPPPPPPPPPTKVYGTGMVYTEVFDLDGLGWTDMHPAYIFGQALGQAIREQQADAGGIIFAKVKVLVAERDQARCSHRL